MQLLKWIDLRDRIAPILASQAVGVGSGLGGVALVSRLISPSVFGGYGVFLTFTTLGMWLVHSGLIKYANRHWAESKDHTAFFRQILSEWLRKFIWLAAAAGIGAIFVARAGGLNFLLGLPLLLSAAAALSLLSLTQAILQAQKAHWADFITSAIASLTRSFLPVTLFWSARQHAWALYTGFAIHTVVAAAVGLICIRRFFAHPKDGRPISPPSDIYFGWLFTLLALASWTLYGINRWIVLTTLGPTEAGWFTLANNLAALGPTILGTIFMQYFQPGIYALCDRSLNGHEKELITHIDRIVVCLGVVALVSVIALRLVAPFLVGNLIGYAYQQALPWLIPNGCFALTIAIGQFFHIMLLAGRRERSCGRVDLSTAAVLICTMIITAALGPNFYWWAMTLSPLLVIVLTRSLAHAALKTLPDAVPTL